MNYRQKCKIKGAWAFIKYKGDAAIYAVCQNCGFTQHGVYDMNGLCITLNPNKCYKYCPGCGLKMHLFDGDKVYKYEEIGGSQESDIL